MLSDLPVHYAGAFFLCIIMYTPVLLFSTGKYKAGLKCAASTCAWLIMMAITIRLAAMISQSPENASYLPPFHETITSVDQDSRKNEVLRLVDEKREPNTEKNLNTKRPRHRGSTQRSLVKTGSCL